MSEDRLRIAVVDDDRLARMIAIVQLQEDGRYDVREFSSGTQFLAAPDAAPDIVLLDIEMPGINGIEVCRQLRRAGNDHTQVLFVSAHDDLETRLAAYYAGGSDYIVKGYQPEELGAKVRIAEQAIARRQELVHQAQYAQQAAFTAMSSMGEMGVVLQFLRSSYACREPAQLARALFEALAQYGVNCLLGMRMAAGEQCFSSRGECSPLEHSILMHASGMERIFQLRDRIVVNYPKATLLVLDLPLADPDRVGRIRDNLAILVEAADARLVAMEGEVQRLTQASGITRAVSDLTQALTDIDKMQAGSRAQAMAIGADYLAELTDAFVNLGLSEDQEAALARMAHRSHARMEALIDEGDFVGDLLREVTGHLNRLVAA